MTTTNRACGRERVARDSGARAWGVRVTHLTYHSLCLCVKCEYAILNGRIDNTGKWARAPQRRAATRRAACRARPRARLGRHCGHARRARAAPRATARGHGYRPSHSMVDYIAKTNRAEVKASSCVVVSQPISQV